MLVRALLLTITLALWTATVACTPLRPPSQVFPPVPARTVNVEGRFFNERARLPLDLQDENTVLMTGFELGFGEGNDHQISEIGVEVSSDVPPGEVRFAFHEDDSDDFFRPFYAYSFFGPEENGNLEASSDCRGACEVTIQRPRPGEVFLLRGFNFTRQRGRSNLKKLSISPDPARGIVRVEFADNGTVDYSFRLQYAYVPLGGVTGQYRASGTRSEGTSERVITIPREPGVPVLQGFEFEFLNGDHRIGEISILPLTRSTPTFSVRFNDQNTDDPYRVTIDYATLWS